MDVPGETLPPARERPGPARHRTIDRVTQIVEEVVARPGQTFSELVRRLGAAKSSVHGFVQGLLANGWLHEERGRFYLGPALYGLTMATGQIRAGTVTYDDLHALHFKTGLSAYLGIRAGDHLIYITVAGEDPVGEFFTRSTVRRPLLHTAGGKALLAVVSESARAAFLRRQSPSERAMVLGFLEELAAIQGSGTAFNFTQNGSRLALARVVHNPNGEAVAALTLVGPTEKVDPRRGELGRLLIAEVRRMEARSAGARAEDGATAGEQRG